MAWTGDGLMQPFEGLASSGKKYGDGTADANSNILQPLTGTAYQELRNEGGHGILPALTVDFSLIEGGAARGDVELPRLDAVGYGGGNGAVRLPSLSAAGTGTVTAVGRFAVTLPSLIVSGTGTIPWPGYASLTLPRLQASARFGSSVSVTLPRLVVAGTASRVESGTAAVVLPALQATGTLSVASYPSYAAIVLPALTVGTAGVASITLPALLAHGYQAGAISSSGIGVGTFDGWAMNMRTNAVSHITNWPFRQILRWGNKTIGVGADGLYEIGAADDAGQPIAWEWRTGLDDLKQPGVKHVPVVYFDGVITGDIFVTTEDDKGDVRRYRYEAKRDPVHMPHRQKLGLGVRTRNIAIGAKSGPHGAFMELDSLEPEATVTHRSV